MARKTLLVTGAAGFLGRRLCEQAAAGWSVVGLGRRPAPADFRWIRADLGAEGAAASALDEARPQAVIHAAANARTNDCQRDPEAARRDNALASAALAAACAQRGVAMIHCSTDLVFDGLRPGGMYREDDPTGPVNVYGQTKLEAEQRVREAHREAIVCRLPLLVGLGRRGASAFLDAWLDQMRRGEPLTLFADEYRTPLAVEDAAAGLLLVLERAPEARRLGGLLHLGGPQRLNRYELGLLIRGAFARAQPVGEAALIAGLQADVPMAAPRAADVSLDSTRAGTLGFAPRPMAEALRAMAGSESH
jgi:dTDP-4-dehydrorhamnose reductase